MASRMSQRREARRQAELERRVSAVERSSQAAHRSIESGSIDINDSDGNVVAQMGVLVDGAVGIAATDEAVPPAPTAPVLTATGTAISVFWDGNYVDEVPVEAAIAYISVQVLQDPEGLADVEDAEEEWEPDDTSEVARLEVGGGEVVISADAEVDTEVALIAVSAAGVWSDPSESAVVSPPQAVEIEDIPTTDGLPPTSSPTPEVTPGPGYLYVKIPEIEDNPDPILGVRVYVSLGEAVDTDGAALTVVGNGSFAIVRELVDGTPLSKDEEYGVATKAFDADGDGPPSAVATGSPILISFDDVAAEITNAITQADQKAVDAQAAADAASADADAAAAAAAAAAGLAGAKGKVLIQSAAPAEADRLVQNLWIDTTGNANTPKRWNAVSSAWEPVTDKAATDAAAAAAAAQTRADNAYTIAGNAQTAAMQAQTTANGKNTVTYGATPNPATTGRVDGDLHFVRSGTTITGQQRLVSGAWVSETITNAVIANLDAAKITSGFLDVANRIQAGAIVTSLLAAEAITATKLAANAVTADKIMAGAIVADKIASGALDAKTITAPFIRTAATGQRLEFRNDGTYPGVAGYDSTGTMKTHLSSTTGILTATGAVLNGDLSSVVAGSGFKMYRRAGDAIIEGVSNNEPVARWTNFNDNPGARSEIRGFGGLLSLIGKDVEVPGWGTEAASVDLWDTGIATVGGVEVQVDGLNRVILNSAGSQTVTSSTSETHTAGSSFNVNAGSSINMRSDTGTYIRSGTVLGFYTNASTTASLTLSEAGNPSFPRHTTSSSSANAVLTSTGFLYRSTSSRRYKTAIRSIGHLIDPLAITRVDPSSWLDIREIDDWNDQVDDAEFPRRHVGAVAEQLVDAGLSMFVGRDKQNRPDSIFYDRLPLAMIPLLRLLNEHRIATDQRLDALEAA